MTLVFFCEAVTFVNGLCVGRRGSHKAGNKTHFIIIEEMFTTVILKSLYLFTEEIGIAVVKGAFRG